VLKDSILKFLKMDSLIEHMTGYVETRIELLKIEMVLLFILLISVAGAYKIAESVGTSGGFTIVASIYLLVGLIIYAFRNSITEKLESRFQEKMNKKKK
jgi:Mn2+/Fe2+ NRAMP family transporter